MKNALLVIDMQNCYLNNEIFACYNIQDVINYIKLKEKEFDSKDIYFTKFIAPSNPKGEWIKYNREYKMVNDSKYLNDYIDKIKKYINDNNSYIKNTYSILGNQELMNKLDEYDNIYITGVVADCCILSSIYDLIDRGKKVIYCKKGIGALNEESGKAVELVLSSLSPLHVEFIDN